MADDEVHRHLLHLHRSGPFASLDMTNMEREKGAVVPGGQTSAPETPKAADGGEYAVRSAAWIAGFVACAYLTSGNYDAYARERDLHFNNQH